MTWEDLANMLEARAKRLNPNVDVVDLIMAAHDVLVRLADTYDLPAFTVVNEAMALTEPGVRSYELPADFGRLLHSVQMSARGVPGGGQSGLVLFDQRQARMPLVYKEPISFRDGMTSNQGRPQHFTRSQRTISVDPPPDDNLGLNYTIQGAYVVRVKLPDVDLQDEIPVDEPSLLVSGALSEVAGDRNWPQAERLHEEYMKALNSVVTNAAKLKQQYYQQLWPTRSQVR